MSNQEFNYFKRLILTTIITVVIGNIGVWVSFYYNTKFTLEELKDKAEKQELLIAQLQKDKADTAELKELGNDLKNGFLQFNTKIDNITNILISMNK